MVERSCVRDGRSVDDQAFSSARDRRAVAFVGAHDDGHAADDAAAVRPTVKRELEVVGSQAVDLDAERVLVGDLAVVALSAAGGEDVHLAGDGRIRVTAAARRRAVHREGRLLVLRGLEVEPHHVGDVAAVAHRVLRHLELSVGADRRRVAVLVATAGGESDGARPLSGLVIGPDQQVVSVRRLVVDVHGFAFDAAVVVDRAGGLEDNRVAADLHLRFAGIRRQRHIARRPRLRRGLRRPAFCRHGRRIRGTSPARGRRAVAFGRSAGDCFVLAVVVVVIAATATRRAERDDGCDCTRDERGSADNHASPSSPFYGWHRSG